MITQKEIQNMVNTIVGEIQPLRIILFGSYATGKNSETSDIDLCIIEKGTLDVKESRRKKTAQLYKTLACYAVPKDLLLFNENELTQEKNQYILQTIQQQGQILYEAA